MMSHQDHVLDYRLGEALNQVARPHRRNEALPPEVKAKLWGLGVACDELTPRQDVVAQLWAIKRTLVAAASFAGPPPAA